MAETCFVVEGRYADGAEENRKPHREEHLARAKKLADEGALVLAGAFDDMSASMLIFRLESEDAVRAIVETDVYLKSGVWSGYSIQKFTRVI